jgi:hypothetical protein
MMSQPHPVHHVLLPSSRDGRWSVGLAVVSLVSLGWFFLMVASGQRGGDSLLDNWLLTGPMVIVAAAGIAGLGAALLAVLRSHERGLLVVLPLLWGLVVTFFAVGEFAFPH